MSTVSIFLTPAALSNLPTTPIVTIVATNGDVNVYVGEVTQESVVISSSAQFSGSVFLHAIEVGS